MSRSTRIRIAIFYCGVALNLDDKELLRGRNYTWRLINLRQRSEKEIRDRLKLKGFTKQIVEDLIAYFKSLGLINDREFASAWISARLAKPLGFRVIESELSEKGIRKEIIKSLIEEKKRAVNEAEIVRDLANKRISRLSPRNEPADKIKNKLYAYLVRRGFPSDIVINVINKLMES